MRISRIVIAVLVSVLCSGGIVSAEDASDKGELQRIKREMREKKKALKKADRKERSILAELEAMDRDIQTGREELEARQRQLHESEAALRQVELNNADINRDLAALKALYGRRLRTLYKMKMSGGGYAVAVLTSDGIGQTVKRIKYLGIIAERDREIMQQYGRALRELEARQAEITEKRADALASKQRVESKKTELEDRKRSKSRMLASVRGEKGLYEQTLRELEEASAGLWAMIKRKEQERHDATAAAPAMKRREAAGAAARSGLPWPIEGQVLTRFGLQRHPQFGTTIYRRGIEIQAREGESVRAVRDGQVAFADWYKGYGKLVILDHGNGMYTLYGNLSQLDQKKDNRVSKGQVLGLAGETGSLKGAKLYFEIRQNGEALDPLAWLAQ